MVDGLLNQPQTCTWQVHPSGKNCSSSSQLSTRSLLFFDLSGSGSCSSVHAVTRLLLSGEHRYVRFLSAVVLWRAVDARRGAKDHAGESRVLPGTARVGALARENPWQWGSCENRQQENHFGPHKPIAALILFLQILIRNGAACPVPAQQAARALAALLCPSCPGGLRKMPEAARPDFKPRVL